MPRYSEPEEYEDDTVYYPVDDDDYDPGPGVPDTADFERGDVL